MTRSGVVCHRGIRLHHLMLVIGARRLVHDMIPFIILIGGTVLLWVIKKMPPLPPKPHQIDLTGRKHRDHWDDDGEAR